jgi:hypothetical protein
MSSASGLARLRRNVSSARVSVRKRWAPVAAEDEGDASPVQVVLRTGAPASSEAAAFATHPPPAEIAATLREAVAAIHAGPGEVVADALRLFLERYAAAENLKPGRVRYCFVVRLVMQLDEWRADAHDATQGKSPWTRLAAAEGAADVDEDLSQPNLGGLALEFGAYPALAHHLLEGSPDAEPDGRPDAERIAALGRWLDEALPCPGAAVSKEFGCSVHAACCALPFALGYRGVLPESRLRFVARSLLAGEVKAARYSLNYLQGRTADGSDSSDGASGEEDGEGEEESESPDSDDETKRPPFRSLLRARRLSPPGALQPSLTAGEFHAVVRRLGDMDAISVMQLLGYECPPYAKRRSRSGAELVAAAKPYMPRPAGSVLRAYLREVHGVQVDEHEPLIKTMADAMPA